MQCQHSSVKYEHESIQIYHIRKFLHLSSNIENFQHTETSFDLDLYLDHCLINKHTCCNKYMHVFIFSCLEVYSWKWNNDPKGWKLIVFQHRGNDYFLPSYGGGGQNSEPLTEKRTNRQKILLPQRRRSRDNWNQEPDHFVFQGQKQILQKECSVHVIDITVAFIIRACNQSFTKKCEALDYQR